MDPLVSTLWGVLVFDEQVRGGVYLLIAALGAVAMLASVLVLAHSPLLESPEDAPRRAAAHSEDAAAFPHPA
jgi:hypothetical protein